MICLVIKEKDNWTNKTFDVKIFYDHKTKKLKFKLKNVENKSILIRFYNIIQTFYVNIKNYLK